MKRDCKTRSGLLGTMSWYLRLGYGVGQLPEGIKSAAFGFYLLFFFQSGAGAVRYARWHCRIYRVVYRRAE